MEGDLLSLRQDVDDLDDLHRVLRLGAGPHTSGPGGPRNEFRVGRRHRRPTLTLVLRTSWLCASSRSTSSPSTSWRPSCGAFLAGDLLGGLLGGLLRGRLPGRRLLRRRLLGGRLLGRRLLRGRRLLGGRLLRRSSSWRSTSWRSTSWPPSSLRATSSAGDFLAVDFFAVFLAAAAAFLAGAVAFLAAGAAAATVSLGSFFAPEMTFFRSAPGVNFGTAFFFDLMLWPVCGLRTVRALRTRFSNEPKPVIATFSPLATSRVIVSRTDSSAWAAALRFPSKRPASVSMSCDLFTSFPSNEPMQPSPCSTFLQRTLGFCGHRHNQNAAHCVGFLQPARGMNNS